MGGLPGNAPKKSTGSGSQKVQQSVQRYSSTCGIYQSAPCTNPSSFFGVPGTSLVDVLSRSACVGVSHVRYIFWKPESVIYR